ncbi:XshC-Cox1-family protein [Streptomyces cinnamoneus]|uniref:XshC-Cox1-family protein n=1 Tax=Streptomyces cinnamoneus TaxID=53446 RepID=A0A2G1XJQ8_STRCJ|nr:XdhC/CoxI family protein [Streptomyces cinnamoneus]PHQ51494.1 XshC-Cox1-family protein [Streptomyces cinnamoneus]PPT11676.1 XshC-Cox1-family protein [Streptomyces cinnamoneus]
MLDIAEELARWAAQGRDFAVATVVAVSGSAPRGPGAALAVDGSGQVVGSVSGGCVEAAVYDLCVEALQDGKARRERFGYSDDDAFAVGLTCGGTIEVVAAAFPAAAPGREVLAQALTAAADGEAVALARVVRGPDELLDGILLVRPDGSHEGGLGGRPELDRTAVAEAHALLGAGHTGTVELSQDGAHCPGGVTLLVESGLEPPRMIVFGAVDFTAALVRVGKFLGYHVTVCDARPVFATAARFPEADAVVADWPDRYLRHTATDARTVLCVLTHDAKFDVPLLRVALRLPVAFVGAMGSRRTHDDRVRRLREAGVSDVELTRLRAPIGLDLGGRTPQETALSIAAEIVAARHGATGLPLTATRTAIHHPAPDTPARAGRRLTCPAVGG